MKKGLFLLVLAITVMEGCKRGDDVSPQANTTSVKATDISISTIDADALEFYKDAAVLAEWYVNHPAVLQAQIDNNNRRSYKDSAYNDFVAELMSFDIIDEQNNHVSFFSLSDSIRHAFLKDYVKLEAKFLDDKLKIANDGAADDYAEVRNSVFDKIANTASFSETIDFDVEAYKITSANPFEDLNEELEQAISPTLTSTPPSVGAGIPEQLFYKNLVSFGIFPLVSITYNPRCFNKTPKSFINAIRNDIRKGRVLVALPGGTATGPSLVFNGTTYDVGHVAIISKNQSEIPAEIGDHFSFTIGTNSDSGMHHEHIADDWTSKHGMSYLMQPVRKSWKVEYYNLAFGVKVPYVTQISEDVDNNRTYEKIAGVLGKPYCGYSGMLIAKWQAPDNFICSSSAWWAIKEAHNIGIGDWYKSTIFPSGVFESSDMRIVGKTF